MTDTSAPAVPPCLKELRDLKARIDMRIAGQMPNSVGHRGRNLGYADISIDSMIGYYMQLWRKCPAAQSELPELMPLDSPTASRGRPARFIGRPFV